MPDGYLVLGTKVDTSDLKKQLSNLQDKLENEELSLEIKKDNLEKAKITFEEIQGEIKKAKNELDKLENTLKSKKFQLNIFSEEESKRTLTTEESFAKITLEEDIRALEAEQQKLISQIDAYNDKLGIAENKVKTTTLQFDKQNKKVQGIRENINEIEENITRIEEAENNISLANIKQNIGNIGKSLSDIIKKVVKWGLAIFGIRSTYYMIRSAMSTISQYDTQLKTDMDYIRYAVAMPLYNIVKGLVDLIYKLLGYTAYIAKSWFNIELFGKASAEAFKKANGSATQLRKTLAGFDEMTILNADGSTGSLGANLPSYDLSNLSNMKMPAWVEWIAQNKTLILDFLKQAVGLLATIKIAKWVLGFENIVAKLKAMSSLKAFGLVAGLLIAFDGIVRLIDPLIRFISHPSWENFMDILFPIGETLVGIGIALAVINAQNPIGWITLVVGAITALIGLLGQTKQKNDEATNSTDRLKEAQDRLKEAIDGVNNAMLTYTNAFNSAREAEARLKELEELHQESGKALYEVVRDNVNAYDKLTEGQKEVLDAYLKTLDAQKRLESATEELTEKKKEEMKATLDNDLALLNSEGRYDEYKQKVVEAFDKGVLTAEEAQDRIHKALDGMNYDFAKTFTQDLPKKIMEGFDFNRYKDKFQRLKERVLDIFSFQVKSSASMGGFSFSGFKKGGIAYYNPVKLASGAIINQPNRGVPISGAVGGESGMEGILPLTDNQQMELLGASIGRHVTINLTNITDLDGRQLARSVNQINASSDFLRNR